MIPSRHVKPPRVKRSPVHFECRYLKTVELIGSDGKKNRSSVVIGEVVGIHIDDSADHRRHGGHHQGAADRAARLHGLLRGGRRCSRSCGRRAPKPRSRQRRPRTGAHAELRARNRRADEELRGLHRRQRGEPARARGLDPRADRAERRRQDHGVQLADALPRADRRAHHLPGRRHHAALSGRDRAPRHRALVPDSPPCSRT